LLEEQGDKYEAAKFSPALSSLIRYAYTHFATEERYLVQVHFPKLKQHVLEHIDFIMKTLGLALRIESSGDELRIELLRYLKEWYSSHVLGTDRHSIPCTEKEHITITNGISSSINRKISKDKLCRQNLTSSVITAQK
jgi:hemerythrin